MFCFHEYHLHAPFAYKINYRKMSAVCDPTGNFSSNINDIRNQKANIGRNHDKSYCRIIGRSIAMLRNGDQFDG